MKLECHRGETNGGRLGLCVEAHIRLHNAGSQDLAMNKDQAMLEIIKEQFVEALRNMPARPPVRNRPLKDLVSKYRELEHCTDEIPCNVTRFGMTAGMTYEDFIYAVIWGS
jgi:hypothetical protein